MKTNRSFKAGALVVAGVLTVSATQAKAAPIVINNYSFETVNSSNQPVGFTITGGVGTNPSGSTNYDITTNSGTHYIGTSPNYGAPSVSQITSATAIEGATYNLSVEIGSYFRQTGNNAVPASDYVGTLVLLIGGVAVASNPLATTETPGVGNFNSIESLSYTATASDEGKTVGVEVLGPTTHAIQFDDLQLSFEPASAPEPSTWALLAGGLVSLVTLRRFRRQS